MSADIDLPIVISLPISPRSNPTCTDIEFYRERWEVLKQMMLYQGLINNPILLVFSVCVLYKILFVRQRSELFLVMIPVLLIIQSLWWFIDSLGQLTWGLDYDKYLVIGDITNGLYALGHWIFAA